MMYLADGNTNNLQKMASERQAGGSWRKDVTLLQEAMACRSLRQ
jgi:hypothetical protein